MAARRWTIAILASLSTNFLLLYLGCWEQPCLSWAIFSTYSSWEDMSYCSQKGTLLLGHVDPASVIDGELILLTLGLNAWQRFISWNPPGTKHTPW